MRIAINAKVLSEREIKGIGVYTYNLLKAISEIDKKNQYVIYSNQPIVHKINDSNFQERILKFPNKLWWYLRLPLEFINNKYDLLFVYKEMVPLIKRSKTVVVCHDLGPVSNIYDRVHFWIAINYAFKAADKIIAVSKATKEDIIEKCEIDPAKITVTHLGYDEMLYKPCVDENLIRKVKERYGIRGNYIINTSSILWWRKNVSRLINAFHTLKAEGIINHQLVITGERGEAYKEIIRLIYSLGLEGDVIFLGYIPIEDMPILLSGADVLVFPSLYEGFGLPLLEAMACGCSVVTSNLSAMPEVVGDAGILVDPYNTEEIVGAIEKIVTDPELRNRMCKKGLERARGFSWKKTATETLKVFESLK